jgi:hypothetical protein
MHLASEPAKGSTPSAAPPPDPVKTRQQIKLFVAITLFAGWTALIAYLAMTSRDAIVVSRPQILVAPIVLEADVPQGSEDVRTVKVTQIYRGQPLLSVEAGVTRPENLEIRVAGFGEARGWRGPGDYLLVLQRASEGKDAGFELVPLPPSPGFPPPNHLDRLQPAIYPVTPSVRAQAEAALRLSPN